MKRIPFFRLIVLVLLASAFLPGCKEEVGCIDPTAINYNPAATAASNDCSYPILSLKMTPLVNGEAFSLGETYTINGTKVRIDLFQFYVSQIGVGNIGSLESPEKYLLVKADQTDYEVGQVTAGEKLALAFNIGIDSLTNHADPTTYEASHVLAPQNPTMHWNWDSGYIFIKIEGQVDTDADGIVDGLLEMHIGKDSNRGRFETVVGASASTEDFVISMGYDVADFFDGIDISSASVTHTGDEPALAEQVASNALKAMGPL